MSIHQISCPARILFLDAELAEQDVGADGAFVPEPALWCWLEAGHPGLHHTFTQGLRATGESPPRNFWTRWPEEDEYGPQRETLELPECPERFLEGTIKVECCGLPEGHAGRHGFEFGPPVTAADVLPDWMLRWLDERR